MLKNGHSQLRIPSNQCFYWRNDLGNYILSFTFQFDHQERYEFAYCYPYTYSTMQEYIHNMPIELVSHQVIGQTLQKRNLDLLTIGTGERTVVVRVIIKIYFLRNLLQQLFEDISLD